MGLKKLKSLVGMCLLSIQLLTLSSGFAAEGGGMDGGGGSVLIIKSRPILLDLYVANPAAGQSSYGQGIQLPSTKALKSIYIDRINLKELGISDAIENRLDLWKESSPVTIRLIELAFKGAPLFYTSYQIGVKTNNYYIPEELKYSIVNHEIKTAAYYSKDFGVLVSREDFNQLSLENQIALIIHESLRHIQIQYGIKMSNASIQKISAAITTRAPLESESLDSEDFADGDLWEMIDGPRKQKAAKDKWRQDVCKMVLPLKSELSETSLNSLNNVCNLSSEITWLDFSKNLVEISKSFHGNNDVFWTLHNWAGNFNTKSVSSKLSDLNYSINSLTNAIMKANHATGLDHAIYEANSGIGWITGSKRSVRNSLNSLVKNGFLASRVPSLK